jgi:hypothetical protein
MTTQLSPELARIGDELQRGIASELSPRQRPGWSRRAVTCLVAGGVVAVGGGTAAALSLTTEDVEYGLATHSGHLLWEGLDTVAFDGTNPSCATDDDQTFECTLDRSPQAPPDQNGSFEGEKVALVRWSNRPLSSDELTATVGEGSSGSGAAARGVKHVEAAPDYLEAGEVVGACVGEDADGLRWTCYAGERAVEDGLMPPDVLGTKLIAIRR